MLQGGNYDDKGRAVARWQPNPEIEGGLSPMIISQSEYAMVAYGMAIPCQQEASLNG